MRYSSIGYLISEGFRSIVKQKKMTSASIIIMCATMFIFGAFFLIGENVNYIMKQVESQQGMRVVIKDDATEDEINNLFMNNQNETIKYTTDPVVSSDIIGITEGALVDGLLTNVLESEGKQLVKIVAWYDNEMSYSAQMVRTAKKLANV